MKYKKVITFKKFDKIKMRKKNFDKFRKRKNKFRNIKK